MSYLNEIKELQNHLIKCLDKKVFLVTDFNEAQAILNYRTAIWISPHGSRRLGDNRNKDCRNLFRTQYLITVFWYCPAPGETGITSSPTDCDSVDYQGPLAEAYDLQCELVKCIDEFNCEKSIGGKGLDKKFTAMEYARPIWKNGCVFLRTLWEKDSLFPA